MSRSYFYSLFLMLSPYILTLFLWLPLTKWVEQYYSNLLLSQFIVDLIATFIVFVQSVIVKNSSIYDPYWHVIPMFITYYWATQGQNWWMIAVCYFYCFKQDYTYFRFWPGLQYEDFRYLEFQEQFHSNQLIYWLFSLLSFHIFPTIIVFLGYTPLFYLVYLDFKPISLIGLGISILAVIIQFFADYQLFPYRTKQKKGDCEEGLWNYSRHPNYFGECLFWWGFFIGIIGSYGVEYWWTGLGALSIQLMFVFYSIPNMEKHLLKKRQSYRRYQQEVSCLVPWFRRRKQD